MDIVCILALIYFNFNEIGNKLYNVLPYNSKNFESNCFKKLAKLLLLEFSSNNINGYFNLSIKNKAKYEIKVNISSAKLEIQLIKVSRIFY